jgi:hypothetical protein
MPMESDGDSRDLVPAESGPSLTLETRRGDRTVVVPAWPDAEHSSG